MNSFMPNSEAWRSCFRLPPRVHARYGLLLAGALLMALAASAVLCRIDTGEADAVQSALPLDRVEVLLIGNSQYRAIDTDQLCRPALNICMPGSDYSMQAAVFGHLAPEMPALKVLVIALDNLPLRTPAIARRKGDYSQLFKWGVPWQEIPDVSLFERLVLFITRNRLLKPVFCGPKFDFTYLTGIPDARKNEAQETAAQDEMPDLESLPPASVLREGFSYTPAQGQKKMKDYVRALTRQHNMASNLKAFLEMTAYCREKHIRLVFMNAPVTEAYAKSRPERWVAECEELRRQAEKMYGAPVPLWDEEQAFAREDRHFDDPNHLMIPFIRHLLTPRLNDRLQSLLKK